MLVVLRYICAHNVFKFKLCRVCQALAVSVLAYIVKFGDEVYVDDDFCQNVAWKFQHHTLCKVCGTLGLSGHILLMLSQDSCYVCFSHLCEAYVYL